MSISSQPVRKTGSANNAKFFEIMPGKWKEKEKEISKILFKYLVEIKKAHTFATPTKNGAAGNGRKIFESLETIVRK